MDIFSTVTMIAALTGCIIILGAFYLLYKGIITLSSNKDGNFTIKLKDYLEVGTTVPALGLFVLGFAFECAALYCANNVDNLNNKVIAAVKQMSLDLVAAVPPNLETQAEICFPPRVSSNGVLDANVGPDELKVLYVHISGPGVVSQDWTIAKPDSDIANDVMPDKIVAVNGRVDMGVIQFSQKVSASSITPQPATQLAEIPAGSAYK